MKNINFNEWINAIDKMYGKNGFFALDYLYETFARRTPVIFNYWAFDNVIEKGLLKVETKTAFKMFAFQYQDKFIKFINAEIDYISKLKINSVIFSGEGWD